MTGRNRWGFVAALAFVLAGIAGCGGGGSGGSNDPPAPPGSIRLTPGMTLGRSVFPIGNTEQGGQGQTVAGVPCNLGDETFHIHLHLSLWVNGEQLAIPAGLGFKDPVEENGIVVDGICLYEIHTHDATGIIHVEAPAPRSYTLGQLFQVWGRPLGLDNVAGFTGPVGVYVNGTLREGDPNALPLGAHDQIALVVGAPPSALPVYVLPSGY